MTPDERNMLNDLADKIAQTPAPPRDSEAENIIRTRIGNRPDALYLMTQTVLIQNLALQRAQQQLQDLQGRSGQPQVSSASSWLGQQQAPGYGGGSQQQYSAPPTQYSAPSSGFGGGGFLRGAAQTAAGVAAGTLAAEAIGSMFSHPGGGFFGGNEFAGGGMAPREEIVNNYYDAPGASSDNRGTDRADNFVDPGDTNSVEDSTQYDDNSQFNDSSLDADDGGGFDDNSGDSFV
ncbi:MAG: DUF2076 domain-containing protein [Acidobacteriota bacterium]|nr:DUF2076 domain-containing protein [Acidobacteriota bacterium]